MSFKKVLVRVAITIAILGMGLVAVVWWKLQPQADPQPLPATLIAADSRNGQTLLRSAGATADYQPLSDSFEHQSLISFCGVASGVTVLNAMGRELNQLSFFNSDTKKIRSRFDVMFGGMSLPEITVDSIQRSMPDQSKNLGQACCAGCCLQLSPASLPETLSTHNLKGAR